MKNLFGDTGHVFLNFAQALIDGALKINIIYWDNGSKKTRKNYIQNWILQPHNFVAQFCRS